MGHTCLALKEYAETLEWSAKALKWAAGNERVKLFMETAALRMCFRAVVGLGWFREAMEREQALLSFVRSLEPETEPEALAIVAQMYLQLRNWSKAFIVLADAWSFAEDAEDEDSKQLVGAALRDARMLRANPDTVDERWTTEDRMCRKCEKLGTKSGNDGTVKILVCTRCCLAYYCSAECQVADWPRHKAACHAIDAETCCRWCWEEGAKARCGRCKTARYCDSECQQRHWSSGHKAECGRK